MSQSSLSTPRHLGLILDGNRRWAKANNLPTLEGHRKGYENLKTIGREAIKRGVEYVSAYVFSTENWQRSQEEVDYLMKLLLWVARNDVKELHKEGIRVRFAGSKDRLSKKILDAMQKAEELTKDNDAGTLLLCLNYGGQQEILDAANAATRDGKTELTTEILESYLYTPDIPPIDLIIRTSGEQRLSNFMLWRSAYSELLFVKEHWPAFSVKELDEAFTEFASRQRRFGGNSTVS